MAALTTGLKCSLALAQATPLYWQRDVRSLVPADMVLAKPHDTSAFCTYPCCFTGSKFMCNAQAVGRLRVRKTFCAAYGDMKGRGENFLSVLNLVRERFSLSEKAMCEDKPEGINDPPSSDKGDGHDKKDDEHNLDDAEDKEKDDQHNLNDGEDKEKDAEQEDEDDKKHLKGLKQDLVHALCGTNWGMNANRETHAVIADIITQLEAVNPNPAPTEALELLDGKWIMVYTSMKEFLPFVAARNLPLVNVSKVSQIIDSDSHTVENVVSFTSPYMMTSFTNCASFDVRSPKRVQLKFEESVINTLQHDDFMFVPEQTNFMGHKISLKSLQDVLQPFQDMANQITRKAAEHKPLRIPYPANRVQSWLLTTFVDDSLRIARTECGGVFALIKEGSPILLLFNLIE